MAVTTSATRRRGSFLILFSFLFGIPAGWGLLHWVGDPPNPMPAEATSLELVQRYLEHPVEKAEILMFCCAVGFLLGKFFAYLRERSALRWEMVAAWNGEPLPATEAAKLRDEFAAQPGFLQNTYLGNRVANVLEFVESRGSANELDDHMRSLSDNDAMAQDGSYSFLRFVTWAIPILGFLGTVLGITEAISGVTPEVLEKSLSGVTSGLATAFDTTALALGLTMILMFWTFAAERMEQGVLQRVDEIVESELGHRFERTGPESGQFIESLRQHSAVLLKAMEQLVEKQASVWVRSLEKADAMWNQSGERQQAQVTAGLREALEGTLERHSQRLAQLEDRMLTRTQGLVAGIAQIAATMTQQAETLVRLQDHEAHLLRLQESLNQNLNTLASTTTFEQAIQSLTAAIHLLTSRAGQTSPAALPQNPRLGVHRPGQAA